MHSHSLRYLCIAINDIGQICKGHDSVLVLLPFIFSHDIGLFGVAYFAVGKEIASYHTSAATATVPVGENNFLVVGTLATHFSAFYFILFYLTTAYL